MQLTTFETVSLVLTVFVTLAGMMWTMINFGTRNLREKIKDQDQKISLLEKAQNIRHEKMAEQTQRVYEEIIKKLDNMAKESNELKNNFDKSVSEIKLMLAKEYVTNDDLTEVKADIKEEIRSGFSHLPCARGGAGGGGSIMDTRCPGGNRQ